MKSVHSYLHLPMAACAAVLLLLASQPAARAASGTPPGKLTYQGFLADGNGVPLGNTATVNSNVVFRIFGSAAGSDLVWSSAQVVTIDKGHFSVLLGEGGQGPEGANYFSDDLTSVFSGPDASDRYLEITVQGATVTPRLRFLPSPYALLARNATQLLDASGAAALTVGPSGLSSPLPIIATSFSGSAANLTGLTVGQIPDLPATKITGRLTDAQVSANVALLNTAGVQTFTGGGVVQFNGTVTFGTGPTSTPKIINHGAYHGRGEFVLSQHEDPSAVNGTTYFMAGSPGQKSVDIQFRTSAVGNPSWQDTLRVCSNGGVAIGSSARPTKGLFEVTGHLHRSGIQAGFLNSSGHVGTYNFPNSDGGIPVSIACNQGIWAGAAVIVSSDLRTKEVRGVSDSNADLTALLGIQIADYQYKDFISRGSEPQKKVIAQQVENVFPQAVSRSTDVVPDIYREAAIEGEWIVLETDLRKGDRVKLIAEDGEGVHEVLEVGLGRFRTDLAGKGKRVFVFGREVKDFRAVDYDAIAMLNVSATQELARQVAALRKTETRVAELEREIAQMGDLKRDLAQLQQLVIRMTALRTVEPSTTVAALADVPAQSSR